MRVCIVRSLVAARMIISWPRLHPSPSTNFFLWESWLKPSEIQIIRPTKSIWMILTGTTQIPWAIFWRSGWSNNPYLNLPTPFRINPLWDQFRVWLILSFFLSLHIVFANVILCTLLNWWCQALSILCLSVDRPAGCLAWLTLWIYRYLHQLLPLTFTCIFFSFPTSDVYMMTWFLLEKPQGYSTNTSNRVIRCTAFLHPSSWSQ